MKHGETLEIDNRYKGEAIFNRFYGMSDNISIENQSENNDIIKRIAFKVDYTRYLCVIDSLQNDYNHFMLEAEKIIYIYNLKRTIDKDVDMVLYHLTDIYRKMRNILENIGKKFPKDRIIEYMNKLQRLSFIKDIKTMTKQYDSRRK